MEGKKLKLLENGWFNEQGAENDVVVSSRVRLCRNIENIVFPAKMDKETEEKFFYLINDSVSSFDGGGFFKLSSLSFDEKKMLSERSYIKAGAAFEREQYIYIPDGEEFIVIFNDTDHIRIKSLKGGLDLRSAYNNCNHADNILEEKIYYSFSTQFGYRTSSLTDTGTGLNCSVMLFLPAIVRLGKIEKVLKEIVQSGLSVSGFVSDDESSSGDLYIIENQFAIGESEEEIIRRLESISVMLTDHEREARRILYRNEKASLEDEILRSLGILKYCRLLTLNEAVKNLSLLKLGKYLNIINEEYITYSMLNCLLIGIKKAHLKDKLKDIENEDEKRAEFVKTKLFKGSEKCSRD